MIASIVTVMHPVSDSTLPASVGHISHGLFFALLSSHDTELADHLHERGGTKPFTTSPIQGKMVPIGNGTVQVFTSSTYWFRFTLLDATLFSPLVQALYSNFLVGETLRFGPLDFVVDKVIMDDNEFGAAGVSSYERLRESANRTRDLTLEFLSPTAFRSGDVDALFPTASSVFSGYARKWNSFSSQPIELSSVGDLDRVITVIRYSLETKSLRLGKSPAIGFVGKCLYRIRSDDPEVLRNLNALASFAEFCGTGRKTTMGMGQTRRL